LHNQSANDESCGDLEKSMFFAPGADDVSTDMSATSAVEMTCREGVDMDVTTAAFKASNGGGKKFDRTVMFDRTGTDLLDMTGCVTPAAMAKIIVRTDPLDDTNCSSAGSLTSISSPLVNSCSFLRSLGGGGKTESDLWKMEEEKEEDKTLVALDESMEMTKAAPFAPKTNHSLTSQMDQSMEMTAAVIGMGQNIPKQTGNKTIADLDLSVEMTAAVPNMGLKIPKQTGNKTMAGLDQSMEMTAAIPAAGNHEVESLPTVWSQETVEEDEGVTAASHDIVPDVPKQSVNKTMAGLDQSMEMTASVPNMGLEILKPTGNKTIADLFQSVEMTASVPNMGLEILKPTGNKTIADLDQSVEMTAAVPNMGLNIPKQSVSKTMAGLDQSMEMTASVPNMGLEILKPTGNKTLADLDQSMGMTVAIPVAGSQELWSQETLKSSNKEEKQRGTEHAEEEEDDEVIFNAASVIAVSATEDVDDDEDTFDFKVWLRDIAPLKYQYLKFYRVQNRLSIFWKPQIILRCSSRFRINFHFG
jgi:antitoxin component of MazEF toxin-antitoxin module